MSDDPHKRRWSFTLRTLFVVMTTAGIVMGWLGQQINWIRERREVIKDRSVVLHASFNDDNLPWPLTLVIEDGWGQINYAPELATEQKAELRRLFPEARLVEGPWRWPVPATH
jgi:hypothetical protein